MHFSVTSAKEVGAEAVAVGHHLDDQAETLLLNLLRGAGPHGLAAMPWSRELMSPQGATIAQDATIVHLIRPLLGTARSELERLAQSKGWVWRDDQSNTNHALPTGATGYGTSCCRC